MKVSVSEGRESVAAQRQENSQGSGALIVNADDWGRDTMNTDPTLECIERGSVTSVSAMVFMEDSERAAAIATERKIDAGLHLNFTTPFTGSHVPAKLSKFQGRISQFLLRRRVAQAVFHPGLVRAFEYVVAAQIDEFGRLYGANPERIDGHHHMHLCANVTVGRLMPTGTRVRRNFSFQPGEKSFGNRMYRRALDGILARRHRLTDYFFSLPPLEPVSRLQRIFSLSREKVVEVETHPVTQEELKFLLGEEFRRLTTGVRMASTREI